MTFVRALLLLGLPVLIVGGCASFLHFGIPSDPVERLRHDIDLVLSDSVFERTQTSIKVKSLDVGDVLYERHSRLLMRPGSNTKLLTSAAAIALLGTDFRFTTIVLADTPVIDGSVMGNLYLRGRGNPNLLTADLESLAVALRSSGISSVRGDLILDVGYFDSLYWGRGWQWDDEPTEDAPFLSALSVNRNCVRVTVTPGRKVGDSVRVQVAPPTSYVVVMNRGRTVADTAIRPLIVSRQFVGERRNLITLEGEMLTSAAPREYVLSVWRPELYTGTLFREALERQGIVTGGVVRVGTVPDVAREVATHMTTMDSVIVRLKKESSNLSAENLLKILAAERLGMPGTAAGGLSEVRGFLSSLAIDTTSFVMVDGSGLSYYNLLTVEMLVQLLERMVGQPEWFPLFYSSLPVAGVDGTLQRRMKGTPAEGNLRAKTGTLSGVSSLSGYVTTRDGEQLVFSMTMQNYIGPANAVREMQDRIGATLASFSRRHILAPP